MAAGIAYFALISLFPLGLSVIAIAGFFLSGESEKLRIVNSIQHMVPVSTEYLVDIMNGIVNNRGPISLVGLFGMIWSGLTVFSAIRRAINQAWGFGKAPNFLRQGLMDIGMCCVLCFGAFLSLAFSVELFNVSKIIDVFHIRDWTIAVKSMKTAIIMRIGKLAISN